MLRIPGLVDTQVKDRACGCQSVTSQTAWGSPGWRTSYLDPTPVGPLSSGRTGVGSRFEVRQPRLPKAVWEVTDWQQGRSFTWVSTSPGIRSTAVHTVHDDAGGSRLDLSLDWSGPLAWALELLIGRKARGMVETEAETFTRLAEQD